MPAGADAPGGRAPADRRRRRIGTALAIVVIVILTRGTLWAIGEFPLLTPGSGPEDITVGSDGALWFTEFGADKVGRITTSGVVTEFNVLMGSAPFGIASGPDGNLWVTLPGRDRIARMTTAGVVTEFTLPAGTEPAGITAGPDGNIYFTEFAADRIGRLDPAAGTTAAIQASIFEFAVPGAGSAPLDITTGPDGRLWFTQFGSDQIGVMTVFGVITNEFPSGAAQRPQGITAGPDGRLWYGSALPNFVGRINIDGTSQTTFSGFGDAQTSVRNLVAGPADGALWATGLLGHRIIRFSTTGVSTEYPTPTVPSAPSGIVLGPDGNIWFTEATANKIGVLNPFAPDQPTISIGDVTIAEGNAGPLAAAFTVTLSAPSGNTVQVTFATAAGTATAGVDYQTKGGVVTFAPGATSETVFVTINGDSDVEPDETFFVDLSAPVNGLLIDPQGQGTITNDDALAPLLSINNAMVTEGNTGFVNAVFTVTLAPPAAGPVTVDYATASGTAAALADYTPVAGTLTFTAGQTSKEILVPVNGDTLAELNETFFVNLANATNAAISTGQGLGTITNDDAAPTISITDVSTVEGDAGTSSAVFAVQLSAGAAEPVTVQYASTSQTAVAGTDFMTAAGAVTFAPGETTRTIPVAVIGDLTDEANETFAVDLSGITGPAVIADPQGIATIVDTDAPPSVSIADGAIAEPNSGTIAGNLTVSLSAPSGLPITVGFATANGTALAPADYASTAGTLSFNPGETSKSIPVVAAGDKLAEGPETFALNLATPANVTIADGQAVVTIVDNDLAPAIQITSPTTTGAFTGTTPFLTMGGTASDDSSIASIAWSNDRGGSGLAEGTTNWTVRDIPLRAGVNIITVVANDRDETAAADAPAGLEVQDSRLNTTAATLVVTVDEFVYFLAEGATGSFFDLDILVGNPNDAPAPIIATFLRGDGSSVDRPFTLAPRSRLTLPVETIPGLETASIVSTLVRSTAALPLMVERTMFWDPDKFGSHGGTAVEGARTRWLFAEGSQGFFDTFVLLANANDAPATVTLTFLTEFAGTVVVNRTVPAKTRQNVWTREVPQLVGKSFSIVVDSDLPIIAERAMYFPASGQVDPGGRREFEGGHETAGVSEPATSWFHSEGATGSFFDMYILIGNANSVAANVTMTYLLETGETIVRQRVIAPNARLTVFVDGEDARLAAGRAVSTTVVSDVPVISERAMYWPGNFTQWYEAHSSFGVTRTALKWGLAEGRVGGAPGFDTFILLANTGASAAEVRVTYLRENGTTVVRTHTVPPTSRTSLWVNALVTELSNESFAAIIEVLNGVPIVVERALYNSSKGVAFAGGTNAVGVILPY